MYCSSFILVRDHEVTMNTIKMGVPRENEGRILLFCLLVHATTVWTKNLDPIIVNEPETEKSILEEEDEPLAQETSTIRYSTTTDTHVIFPSTRVFEKLNFSNETGEFRPSVHLGEIEEPRIRNPFNKLQHIKFDNTVDLGNRQGNFQNFGTILQPTRLSPFSEVPRDDVQRITEKNEKESQKGRVKFEDDTMEMSRIRNEDVSKDRKTTLQPTRENSKAHYEFADQQFFQNLEKPAYETTTFFGKPTKFQSEAEKHELGVPSAFDGTRSPYLTSTYDYGNFQPVYQEYETMRKPDNSVVYVHKQESSFTRTRKFPYPYYQPSVGYHEMEFMDDGHGAYPRKRRMPPLRKILHLLGAFLPLGLLLATLTPNVVKIDNTTQPNIVLSKLRVADLPLEHKQARLLGDPSTVCEERSICELVSAGDTRTLQNLLRNLADRSPETENSLLEVFEAARKKDCTSIVC